MKSTKVLNPRRVVSMLLCIAKFDQHSQFAVLYCSTYMYIIVPVKGCVREVSLAQVSCILMYVYVAPPTPVGAWSMALGLRQRFEYYYYY